MERNDRIENVRNVRLSDETRRMLLALVSFEESFWNVCDALTEKSDGDEKTREAFELVAEREQEKAREAYYKTIAEMECLIKDRMFQIFFDTDCEEI